MKHKPTAAERGFSLVEVVITIVVIGIALLAAVGSWSNIASNSADVLWQTKVSYLGQAYLEEVLSQPFDENTPLGGGPCAPACSAVLGPEAGETRTTFDDVDDFNNLNEPATGLFLQIVGGAPVQAYVGYGVAVTVTYAGQAIFGAGADNQLVKQVVVTVTPPGNTGQGPVAFSGLKGNF